MQTDFEGSSDFKDFSWCFLGCETHCMPEHTLLSLGEYLREKKVIFHVALD